MDRLVAMATVLAIIGMQLVCVVAARGPPKLKSDAYQMRRVIRAGETLRLTCPVESPPPAPLFTWSKDGDPVHVGWDRYRTNADALRVRDLERSDSGVFICRATNGFGTLDVKYLVYVYVDSNDTTMPPDDFDEEIFHPVGSDEAPKFVSEDHQAPPFMSPSAGTTVRLGCRSTGSPRPEVTWSKDGVVLSPTEGVLASDGSDTLLLPEVTQSDSGRYTCRVTNRAGSITRHYVINVDVTEADKSQSILPPHPENSTIGIGGSASFLCHVHSTNEQHPNIQWLKRIEGQRDQRRRSNATIVTYAGDQYAVLMTSSSQQHQGNTRSHVIHTTPHGDGTFTSRLTVSGVDEADAGLYVCVIVGRHGGRSFRSAFLTVAGKRVGQGQTTGDDDFRPDTNTSSSDTGFVPIVAALAAVGAILVVAVVGFVVHRRRTSKSSSSPSSSGSVGAATAVTSSLLATSSGGINGTHQPRRAYDPSAVAANTPAHGVNHRQHLIQYQHSHQPHLYAETIDRYPPTCGMMNGMSPARTAGSAGSGSAGNGAVMGSATTATGRDRFVGRHPADTTSYSDYSSISRNVGSAMPSPHMYALQQQQQHPPPPPPHVYQHPLYQMQAAPTSAAGPATQLHYYEEC